MPSSDVSRSFHQRRRSSWVLTLKLGNTSPKAAIMRWAVRSFTPNSCVMVWRLTPRCRVADIRASVRRSLAFVNDMMFPFYPRQVLTGPLGYALSWGRFVYAALLIEEYAGCRS